MSFQTYASYFTRESSVCSEGVGAKCQNNLDRLNTTIWSVDKTTILNDANNCGY